MFERNGEDDRYGSIAFLDGPREAGRDTGARHRRPKSVAPVSPADPASSVMTDFTSEMPVTVVADRFIDDALHDMLVAGVRALLVMRGEVVVGLITSYDIQGERPLQFLDASGLTRRDDIEVGHIMTPFDEVPTLDVPWVSSASVGDLIARFRRKRHSHLLVVEYSEQGGAFIRGMFSRTELGRRLGRQF